MAKRQLTMGDCYDAADALAFIQRRMLDFDMGERG